MFAEEVPRLGDQYFEAWRILAASRARLTPAWRARAETWLDALPPPEHPGWEQSSNGRSLL
ncbi:MAG: hypothetical protein ACRDZ3_17765 [Acidimicrobiia bacterium]